MTQPERKMPPKVMTTQEIATRARRRFKAVVWLAHANRHWLMEEEEDDSGGLSDKVTRNITKSLRSKGSQMLSFRHKCILNKAADLRTDEEKHELLRAIGGLKCFQRYPTTVKEQLPTVMYFACYGPNRVLTRQDADPHNMYVLVSGQLEITREVWDNFLKERVTKVLGVVGAGTIVGEVSLLHGIKRTATVTTVTPCELLYLKSDDFNSVLKVSVAAVWQEIEHDMSRFEYFDEWKAMEKREACILSRREEFKLDQVILGDGIGLEQYAHFVTKGRCYMVEMVLLRVFSEHGVTRYELTDESENKIQFQKHKKLSIRQIMSELERQGRDQASLSVSTQISKSSSVPSKSTRRGNSKVSFVGDYKLKWHFIKICTFNQLACFNVGEELKNRLIVSGPGTEILYLPRYFLLERAASIVVNVKHHLTSSIPNTKQLFEKFVNGKVWQRYKAKVVKNIIMSGENKRTRSVNTINNVPYSIRLADDVGYY